MGSRSYLEEYAGNNVETWVQEILKLSELAMSQLQAAYAAFSFGIRHKWTYFLRTIPNIGDLLQPLEEAIRSVLIPISLNHMISNQDRHILELPVRLGGLGIVNPSTKVKSNYQYSKHITRPLTKHIIEQKHELPDEAETLKITKQVVKDKLQKVEQQTKDVLQEPSEEMQRAVKLSQEKGSSSWLSIIPLKEMGFTLNKKEFHDAVSLRYDWEIKDIPSKCVRGERFDVNHAMICMKGGFVVQDIMS